MLGHDDAVTAVTVHPSGDLIATGSADDTIMLWSGATYTPILRFKGHAGGVCATKFSADCALLFVSGSDAKAKVFDLTSQRLINELEGTNVVNTFALHRSGSTMITGSASSEVHIWRGLRPETWSPQLHPYIGDKAREFVMTVLLIAERCAWYARRRIRGALPELPIEMWMAILSCMSQSDLVAPSAAPPGLKSNQVALRTRVRRANAVLVNKIARRRSSVPV